MRTTFSGLSAGRRAAFVTAAVVAIASVATTAAMRSGPDRPKPPKLVNAWQLGGAGDGLNRFVVKLASSTAAAQPVSAPAAAPGVGTAPGDASGGGGSQLDVAALRAAEQQYGTGGTLVSGAGGAPFYVIGGTSIPVGAGAARPARQVPVAAPVADPLEALAGQPGVTSAQRLHDGTALIATKLDAAQVSALPGVTSVAASPLGKFDTAAPSPNDPYFSYEWWMKNTGWAYQQPAVAGDDIDALDAWPITKGAGTVVADIDSGMANVSDLANALWTNPNEACGSSDTDKDGYAGDCHGWNFYANNSDLTNGGDNAHGTGVAGVIAATANNGVGVAGEAPDAKVMPLVVGSGAGPDMNLSITAMYYAVDHGASVINCSFGGGLSASQITAMTAAIDYAGAHNVLVVASAGNESSNDDTTKTYPASIIDPNLIVVGATDASNNLSSFSNYGPTTVDLFAPGTNIATTGQNDTYVQSSGTSLSSPIVATAIAMMRSADPSATAAQLRSRLLSTTTPVAALAGKGVTAGVLNIGAALGAGPGVVHYHFTNLAYTPTGSATNATLAISGSVPAGPYTLSMRLATRYQGATYAVSGVPVSVDGTSVTTDDSGAIAVALSGNPSNGVSVHPNVALPDGQYAWVSQLSAAGHPIGQPAAVVFTVGGQPPASVSPSPSQSSATGGSTGGGSTGGGSTGGGSTGGPTGGGTTTTPADGGSGTGGSTTAPPSGGTTTAPTGGGSTTPPGTGGATGGGSGASATSAPSGGGPTGGGSGASATSAPSGGGPTGGGSATQPADGGSGTGGSTGGSTPPSAGATTAPPSGGSTGGTVSDPTSPPTSGGSGSETFPGSDPFEITGVSPATVSGSGVLVHISGHKLPSNVSLLVGGIQVRLLAGSASSAGVTFYSPAYVPGTYDIDVYDTSGTGHTNLPHALTITAVQQPSSSPDPTTAPAPGGGTGSGSTSPSGGATTAPSGGGSTSAPSGGSTTPPSGGSSSSPSYGSSTGGSTGGSTGAGSGGSTGGSTGGSGGGSSSAPTWTKTVVSGPGGLRLVGGDPSLSGLDSLWGGGSCGAGGCDAVSI